ncbi:DUF424 family protein, partial [Candidatus Micrarchaeota archaeon]|nr:DUF424 family protein [Candidatus Micrarchaeota archaeon]
NGEIILYHKIHSISGQTILAVCDKELVGKSLKEKGVNFFVSPSFYKGELIGEEGLKKLLRESDSANLIGEKAVGIALREGIVLEEDVIRIKNVPHVQIYKV